MPYPGRHANRGSAISSAVEKSGRDPKAHTVYGQTPRLHLVSLGVTNAGVMEQINMVFFPCNWIVLEQSKVTDVFAREDFT